MKRILVIASLIFSLGMGLMACSDDDGATCSSALNNFYDQGCSMFVDGDQLSRQEAIEGCKDSSSFYHDCGCGGVFQNVLDRTTGGRGQKTIRSNGLHLCSFWPNKNIA